MKTLSTIQAMQKWRQSEGHQSYPIPDAVTIDVSSSTDQPPVPDQYRQLVEAVRQYRHYQKLSFAKRRKGEFYKDEEHFMMKYQDKLDRMLSTIQL